VGVTAFNLSDDVPGAVPLGSFVFDMGGLPSLWAVPEGSLWNETALPNMVFIGVIQTDVGQVFTGEFQELLVKCIRWATDDYEPISVNDPQQEGLLPGPNPTTGLVHVSLTLPEAGNVTVHIYDMTGRLMSTADQGYLAAGENTLQFDISELPDAQYIYEVLTSSEVLTGKLIKE
jgi:hypothetical protein